MNTPMRGVILAVVVLHLSLRLASGSVAYSPHVKSVPRGGGENAPDVRNKQKKKVYKTVQAHIIHRHGDRTPITPLKDEDYWSSTLCPPELLDKLSQGTREIRTETLTHKAGGRGPFGKLTQMGIFQMVDVGNQLRDDLCTSLSSEDACRLDEHGNRHYEHLWYSDNPMQLSDIKTISTDFPRTIQSLHGVLVGMFPDGFGDAETTIDIDCRHTAWLIPDPQPRRSQEQEQLEVELASRDYFRRRDADMLPLARKVTEALAPLLAPEAFDFAFGVGEDDGSSSDKQKVLTWAQLAEITKCLQVRGKLPPAISKEEQTQIIDHLAWRWFESLKDARLIHLAMHKFASEIVHAMRHCKDEESKKMIIYSAHDSSLIALMCMFRLELPSKWPEYSSFLKVELVEVSSNSEESSEGGDASIEYFVRFYLNGNLIKSKWDDDHEAAESISLQDLAHRVKTVGAHKRKAD